MGRGIKIRFLIILLTTLLLDSCRKKEPVAPVFLTAETLQELIKSRNINRVIASDTQAFLNDLSFSEDYGFDFSFKDNFVGVYGQFWNLEFLKRYEIVQRGNTIVLLLLFRN